MSEIAYKIEHSPAYASLIIDFIKSYWKGGFLV